MLLTLIFACATPTTPEACADLPTAEGRDTCFIELLPAVFKTDPKRGITLVESLVTDATTRDFIWLTVTRDVDPNTTKYCDRIKDERLAERCRVLVGRPHLHREEENLRLLPNARPAPKPGDPGARPPGEPGSPAPGQRAVPGEPPPPPAP